MESSILIETPKHKTSYVTITKDEYDSMKDTIDAFKDKELMKQLAASEKAASEGRVKNWKDYVKEKD